MEWWKLKNGIENFILKNMREILFRGIILNPTDMFSGFWYGDLIQFADGTVGIRQQQTGTEMQVIPDSVGQFTGLLDKNGTRVFSDDLMKSPEGDIFRIYQVDGGFVIKGGIWLNNTSDLSASDELILIPLTNPQLQQWIKQCEIIENIHES